MIGDGTLVEERAKWMVRLGIPGRRPVTDSDTAPDAMPARLLAVLLVGLAACDAGSPTFEAVYEAEVDTSDDDDRTAYHGTVTYGDDESTEELLDQFKQINSE